MEPKTVKFLLELNQQFYQTFALPFSSTRMKIQPGIRQLIPLLTSHHSILDLGCGNGELALELYRNGFEGKYIGLDFSANLLKIAQARLENSPYFAHYQPCFYQADITHSDWLGLVKGVDFEVVVAFAVLHHIPGREYRLRIFQSIHEILLKSSTQAGSGKFIFSVWQFLNSERQRKRIHEWKELGLSPQEVDENDYLLDWKEGGFGFRYAHHFTDGELALLAQQSGFVIRNSFSADGREGNLALYQIWEAA